MIELKNITKTYRSKKGPSTDALKGINLKLGDRGLTFILGKSGSGKSTLLNIIGGLDTYTSGEFILNGKTTSNFKEKDWDAYRNSYMGFVFQEFNLLDNYSVEDNIKLAIELQHKHITTEEIRKSLEIVGLEGMEKRKPNELSGGQKQRVAIARVIIKNPTIILADEPTGNLDSLTSEQIFEIFKNISKEKLVIVVSHDEESAKKYADRIIKITDGQIEYDSKKEIDSSPKELKLIDANLPKSYSIKMGLLNLFHKKFKLIFTIMTVVLALICLGITTSSLNIDLDTEYFKVFEENSNQESFITKYDKNLNQVEIYKQGASYVFGTSNYNEINQVQLDDTFLKEANEKTDLTWKAEYSLYDMSENLRWEINIPNNENQTMYQYSMSVSPNLYVVLLDESLKNNLIGNAPYNADEIVISSYIADMIMYAGIQGKYDLNSNELINYKPTSYTQIINDEIYLNLTGDLYFKITGILDCSEKLEYYNDLKNTRYSTWIDGNLGMDENNRLNNLYSELFTDRLLLRIYVSNSFIEKMTSQKENRSTMPTKLIMDEKTFVVDSFGFLNESYDLYDSNTITKIDNINKGQIIINTALLNSLVSNDFNNKKLENPNLELNEYLKSQNIIGQKVKTSIKDKKIYTDIYNYGTYEIIGVIEDNNPFGTIYYNEEEIDGIIDDSIKMMNIYTVINTKEEMKKVLEYYPIDDSDTILSNQYTKNIFVSILISNFIKSLGQYGSIFFIILAALILMTFISTSISYRKKEIGTLRALGCSSKDVIKLFIYENLAIIIISLAIAYILTPKIIGVLNKYFIEALGIILKYDVLKFGIIQALFMAVIMFIIVILASIIPLRKLTKAKPIDTILDK